MKIINSNSKKPTPVYVKNQPFFYLLFYTWLLAGSASALNISSPGKSYGEKELYLPAKLDQVQENNDYNNNESE
jgi:hypothetical protein